jgi:hypothetical protein
VLRYVFEVFVLSRNSMVAMVVCCGTVVLALISEDGKKGMERR